MRPLFSFLLFLLSFNLYASDQQIRAINPTDLLEASETYTSPWVNVERSSGVKVSCKSDQDATLYAEFSRTGGEGADFPKSNLPSSLPVDMSAGVRELVPLTKISGNYFRIQVVNGSSSQGYFECSAYATDAPSILTSLANGVIQQDAPAIVTRTIPNSIEVASGKFQGWQISPKLGLNQDIDSGSTPEDVIDVGGTYSGFPVSTVEKLECFSSSTSDTGTLTIGGILDSTTDTDHGSETITLSGQTPVDTVSDVWRAHTMRYESGSATTFNVGTITCRHTTTTTNVFLTIPIGRSQSNYMVYTCPYLKTCWIKTLQGSIRRGTSATVDGALWFRSFGGSPRYRRPFTIGNNAPYQPPLFGAIRLPGRSDIKATVLNATANDIAVTFGMEIIAIDD